MTLFHTILIALCAAAVAFLVAAIYFTRRTQRKVSYMLDALEDKETNFRFKDTKTIGRRFNRTLNRIRTIFDRESEEIKEQERYYGQMLDHVLTGTVVYEPVTERVVYSNQQALDLLGFSTLSNLRQLKVLSEEVYAAFRRASAENAQKATFYTDRLTRRVSLLATETTLKGRQVKIVTFNDMGEEMDENEAESWTRLIRVLTHEIMNTVSPIASLSETLQEYLKQTDDVEKGASAVDLETGLETISASSRGLIRFVESYRNVLRIATPVRKALYVRDVVENVIKLSESFELTIQFVEKTDDVLLYADEGQITQILINLVKNAAQAKASRVEISAEIDRYDAVVITVANNGVPISHASREEIFVPFYTTKQDGSGIGLSLSRQIMRLHGGTLTLKRSDDNRTVFMLVFK